MIARCKFKVESVTHYAYGGREVKLQALYDKPLSEEDRAFSNATPSGTMSITIQNPKVFDVFKPGNSVYIDVSVVPE